MLDVKNRFDHLRKSRSELNLYALVDGIQYQHVQGERLHRGVGLHPLFADTPDAALSHAGPWLIDTTVTGSDFLNQLAELKQAASCLIWIITPQDLTGLVQLLQLRLDVRLPDGRLALLRFWDPRVMVGLTQALNPIQTEEFFGHIHEWHMMHERQRVWIGRQDAHTH